MMERMMRKSESKTQVIAGTILGAALYALMQAPPPITLELPAATALLAALPTPRLALRVVVDVRP